MCSCVCNISSYIFFFNQRSAFILGNLEREYLSLFYIGSLSQIAQWNVVFGFRYAINIILSIYSHINLDGGSCIADLKGRINISLERIKLLLHLINGFL